MPTFLHGKNTRVLLSNPSFTNATISGTWATSSSTIYVANTPVPLYVGMTVSATTGLPAGTITTVSANLANPTITVSSTTTGAQATLANVVVNSASGYVSDLSPYFNDVSVMTEVAAEETTTFQTGGVKSFITGLRTGTLTLSGFYEGTIQGVDTVFTQALYSPNDDGVVVFPDGGTATATGGKDFRCSVAQGIETKYELKSPVAGVVAVDGEIQSDGGVWRGVGQFIPSTVLTGSGTTYTAPSNTSGASTTLGGQLQIGVISLNGTSPTISVQLQNSPDNSTWTNVGTALTSIGSSIQILSGSIYAYTRLAVTLGGTSPSATIYYGFARY